MAWFSRFTLKSKFGCLFRWVLWFLELLYWYQRTVLGSRVLICVYIFTNLNDLAVGNYFPRCFSTSFVTVIHGWIFVVQNISNENQIIGNLANFSVRWTIFFWKISRSSKFALHALCKKIFLVLHSIKKLFEYLQLFKNTLENFWYKSVSIWEKLNTKSSELIRSSPVQKIWL